MKTPAEIRSWLDIVRKAFPGSILPALADLVTAALTASDASDFASTDAEHLEAEARFHAALAALADAVGYERPLANLADARVAREIRNLSSAVEPPDGWQGEVMARIRKDRGDA